MDKWSQDFTCQHVTVNQFLRFASFYIPIFILSLRPKKVTGLRFYPLIPRISLKCQIASFRTVCDWVELKLKRKFLPTWTVMLQNWQSGAKREWLIVKEEVRRWWLQDENVCAISAGTTVTPIPAHPPTYSYNTNFRFITTDIQLKNT